MRRVVEVKQHATGMFEIWDLLWLLPSWAVINTEEDAQRDLGRIGGVGNGTNKGNHECVRYIWGFIRQSSRLYIR